MDQDQHETLRITGPDYVQVYVNGESELVMDSSDLGGEDVTVELHDYGDKHD